MSMDMSDEDKKTLENSEEMKNEYGSPEGAQNFKAKAEAYMGKTMEAEFKKIDEEQAAIQKNFEAQRQKRTEASMDTRNTQTQSFEEQIRRK